MKQKLTLRWWIIKLSGILFAAYSAYNVFILLRDGIRRHSLSSEGLLISAIVALLFAVLAVFAWTSEIKKKRRFRLFRRVAFTIALLAIFGLKLRMIEPVINCLELLIPQTIMYVCSYFLTLLALFLLFVYYTIIIRRPLLFLKASTFLPVLIIVLFLISLILEMIIFLGYGINIEASALRTAVIRPVFYLGFIGLTAYYLLPAEE